jgi:hypothetical protein
MENNRVSEDYVYQVSFKTPTQTLINIRVQTEEEFQEGLDMLGRQLKGVAEVEAILGAMTNIYAGMSPEEKVRADAERGTSQPAQQAQQQAAPSGAPAGQGKMCEHGQKQWKEGVGNGGRAWKAWMCPAPKGTPGQCAPEWVR